VPTVEMVQYGKDELGGPDHGEKHSSKLPSASELRAINEARNLYKSNTFKAQASFSPRGTPLSIYISCSSFCS
jgi:hypothetical protein